MTSPGPRREQEQDPRIRLGVHLVSLGGGKVDQASAPYFLNVGTACHHKRAIEHGDPCVLVYLVFGKELVLVERERDHASRTVIRPQNLRPTWLGRKRGDLPDIHRPP